MYLFDERSTIHRVNIKQSIFTRVVEITVGGGGGDILEYKIKYIGRASKSLPTKNKGARICERSGGQHF